MLFEEINNKTGKFTQKKWKDLTGVQKGVVIGGSALVAFILYRGIQSIGGRSNIKDVPVNPDLLTYETTTGNIMQWNPDPLSKEFYENFEGYNFYTYPETTDKLLKLQDEQIKALYNHYNTYYAQDEPTLTKLIDNEWSDWSGSYDKAVSRLKSLGLNEDIAQYLDQYY